MHVQGTSKMGATLKWVPGKIGSCPLFKFHGLWDMQLLSNSSAVSPPLWYPFWFSFCIFQCWLRPKFIWNNSSLCKYTSEAFFFLREELANKQLQIKQFIIIRHGHSTVSTADGERGYKTTITQNIELLKYTQNIWPLSMLICQV